MEIHSPVRGNDHSVVFCDVATSQERRSRGLSRLDSMKQLLPLPVGQVSLNSVVILVIHNCGCRVPRKAAGLRYAFMCAEHHADCTFCATTEEESPQPDYKKVPYFSGGNP